MIERTRSRALAASLALVAGLAPLVVDAPAARAVDPSASVVVEASVEASGAVHVKQVVTPDGAPSQVVQTFRLTRAQGKDSQYRFAMSDVKASVGGVSVAPTLDTKGGVETVTINGSGGAPVELDYTVEGAATPNPDGSTRVEWAYLQGLNMPVTSFDARVTIPGQFTSMDCYSGHPAAPDTCGYFGGGTHDEPTPVFHAENLAAGDVVGGVLKFPAATVKVDAHTERVWSLDGAFSLKPLPVVAALLAALVLGGLIWALRRRWSKGLEFASPMPLASFVPVGAGESEFRVQGGLRAAEVGTLADERVDPIDVGACVLDLAVRGHLVIEEQPRTSPFAPTEWTLRRLDGGEALLPYEAAFLDAVAPVGAEPRTLTQASEALQGAMPAVQDALYADMVRRGWFRATPQAWRSRTWWLGTIGLIVAAVVAVLLLVFTDLGLLALVLIVAAAGLAVASQRRPALTPAGADALAGLDVLRGILHTQPTDQVSSGHQQLSLVLPYTVVLGCSDRWLTGIAATNDPAIEDSHELPWFHGPSGWRLDHLPDSLRAFIRAFIGTLVSRG